MKRMIALSLLLMISGGCMRPLTRRLDETNARLAETNQRLGDVQGKLELTNQQVAGVGGQLDETNRRVGVVDQAIQKLLPGLNARPQP
jgi:hypothetical protein